MLWPGHCPEGEAAKLVFVSSDCTRGLQVRRWPRLGTRECPYAAGAEGRAVCRDPPDARAGMSARAIQRKYRVGRRTIIKALASAWPEPRKKPPRRASKLDPFKPAIDEMLRADLDARRKQRHTITRIYRRLIGEHQMRDVSYPVVRAYVAERRPQIRAETGRGPAEVFVPQPHRPGAEAEVDFGEVAVRLAGEQVSCLLFCLRLSFSGKAVHRVSLSGGQEAFFEGHEHAFRVLGGVPAGKVRYDNLKAAVAQVLGFSRDRVENKRWTAFRSHWDLDTFYCQPGLAGAHEKGGVEGQIGWFRRNHLIPVPDVPSVQALNAMIDQWDADDDARRIGSRARTVGAVRHRETAAQASAGRAVRDRTLVHPASGPVQPGHGADQPVLGPGTADRPPGPGPAARLAPGHLRRPRGGRTA